MGNFYVGKLTDIFEEGGSYTLTCKSEKLGNKRFQISAADVQNTNLIVKGKNIIFSKTNDSFLISISNQAIYKAEADPEITGP